MISLKVVTAVEMARIEAWALDRGSDQRQFMENAGTHIALKAKEMLEKSGGKSVVLVLGKGNKGGDAYVAGSLIKEWGYFVRACPLFPSNECSELNREFAFDGVKDLDFSGVDLIIDGLLGTGFHGQIDGQFLEAIQAINESKKPVLSIDIPSGLNGNTGEVGGCAIKATATVTLGLAKTGLFLQDGWNYTGDLTVEDFGLPEAAVNEAQATFLLPKLRSLTMPLMSRTQHKYQRGFVIGFGGSSAYKGSVKLSCKAALHAGAGIVKGFTLEDVGPVDDELIFQIWDPKNWAEDLTKAQSVFVGPGLGRGQEVKKWLDANLKHINVPCVIDADALFFLPNVRELPKTAILTPHRGEMLHLLGEAKLDSPELLKRCAEYAKKRNVIIVLKGAPTFVFSPGSLPYVLDRGDPGMATAGSGDVLTGIIAALLSEGKAPLDAVILGVTIHGLSGEAAAAKKTSYGYTAGDIIAHLPDAFRFFI
jgi:hydroxyethylthiazole kinase-like uncharacterized protein yjeF